MIYNQSSFYYKKWMTCNEAGVIQLVLQINLEVAARINCRRHLLKNDAKRAMTKTKDIRNNLVPAIVENI